MSQLKIEPAPGLTLGATVTGVDLANLDQATWEKVETAFLEYGVLVFPNQHLSLEAQVAFGKRFGEVEHLTPTRPDIEHYTITNRKRGGQLLKEGEGAFIGRMGTESWHMDSTFMPLATSVSCLQAMEVPSWGGQTAFADMRAAYDSFDQATKDKIAGLSAYHSVQYSQSVFGLHSDLKASDKVYGNTGDAYLRPLVKKHPITGRFSFFAARHAFGIPGMSLEESENFLDDLNALSCQPPRVFEHTWKVGDLVLWDNRCILHRARTFDVANEPRVMRGVRMQGDPRTDMCITGTPEAAQGRARLEAELKRLRAVHKSPDFVPGKSLPRSAL